MFESDDFDEILSQIEIPVASSSKLDLNENNCKGKSKGKNIDEIEELPDSEQVADYSEACSNNSAALIENITDKQTSQNIVSFKQTKRKIIDSHFDQKSKRKFPGPAGLLTGNYQDIEDTELCQIELLSQDVDFSQNSLLRDAFDSHLWQRLQKDIKDWNLGCVDTTKAIKQACDTSDFRKRKAQTVAAFIESIDRSVTDPLVILRDSTGSIKCTLHRDAWSKFAPYIVSECSALVLWKPTILTTGSAFKKHYLIITLSNIFAVYSSAVLDNDVNTNLSDGYVITHEGDITVIKIKEPSLCSGINSHVNTIPEENGLLEELDNIFSDDIF